MKSLRWMLLAGTAGIAGCGPNLSRQDLGEIILEERKLPAFNQPYDLPVPRPPKSGTDASPGGPGQMPRSGQMPTPPATLRNNAQPGAPARPNTPN